MLHVLRRDHDVTYVLVAAIAARDDDDDACVPCRDANSKQDTLRLDHPA
jgi:hypothetical protein